MYTNVDTQYYQYSNENIDRNTPDSSDGIGSSISSSPSPSNSTDSRSVSPNITNQPTYSTPSLNNQNYNNFNYQNYYNYNNYQNNYNQQYNNYNNLPAYNYNIYNSSINRNFNSSINNFDDSTYYSRNNSLSINENLNESIVNKQTESNFILPSVPVAKQTNVSKQVLKFSIDSILSLTNSNSHESPVKENLVKKLDKYNEDSQLNEENDDSIKTKTSKKRKGSKSSESLMNNKRMRTIFTQDQLDKLEIEFNRQQYMVGSERSYLANSLGLSESQVKIWFQNRRIKWRKSQNGTGDKIDDEFLNQSVSNESYADE